MPDPRYTSGDESTLSLACLEVGGQVYALDVTQLREVLRWQAATPLPRAPALIEGVVDVRGAIIPVIDLGRALGRDAVRPGPRARIAVAEIDGLVIGLAVDAVVGITPVESGMLGDPPALATQAGYAAARAVVRRPGAEPMLLLALEPILEEVYRSKPADPEQGPEGSAQRGGAERSSPEQGPEGSAQRGGAERSSPEQGPEGSAQRGGAERSSPEQGPEGSAQRGGAERSASGAPNQVHGDPA